MSYLDRIDECNAHDLSRFVPFTVAGQRVGSVKRAFAGRLRAFPGVFRVADDSVSLDPGLDGFDARSEAVDAALQHLAEDGAVPGWRGEMYPVATAFAAEPLLQMERAAVPLFGVRAYGVHVNGFVRDGGEVRMWIARRSAAKDTYPGMLDNFVAGGQPIGIGLLENVVKEAGEEAGVPPEIASAAVAVGAVSYCHETPDGLKPDVQFAFDMALPPDFEPRNADGEIEEFTLWPVAKVMEVTRETPEFKFNCNLVNIDFFVRHGLIAPDDPDYLEIVRALHQ
ncbi:MAG: DUF4743 domain-containing protein [Proteobacteria bacterium]|nr:DUF4743 domain-containing protein [Pseudomonadota bacterium]